MSAQQIPIVSVSVAVPSTSETRAEEQRRQRRTGEVDQSSEYSETAHGSDGEKTGHADYAEGRSLTKNTPDAFLVHKEKRSLLEKTLKDNGVKHKDLQGGDIDQLAEKNLKTLDGKIHEQIAKQGEESTEVKNLKRKYEELASCLEDYRAALSVTEESVAGKSSVGSHALVPPELNLKEKALLKELGQLAGCEMDPESDTASVLAKLNAKASQDLQQLKTKELSLKSEMDELQKKLQKVQDPSSPEGIQIKDQIEKVKKELEVLSNKQKTIQLNFSRAEKISDQILSLRTKRDLNLDFTSSESETPSQAAPIQSASITITNRTPSQVRSSAQVSTSSVLPSLVVPEGQNREEDQIVSGVSTQSVNPPALQTADVNNNTLSIQSTSAQATADARKTDRMINQLIALINRGDGDAITTCLILMSKKSSYAVINMAKESIKALQYYEKQTASLVTRLNSMSPSGNASYSSQLSGINTQINLYSQNRQAIMSFMQSTLSDDEQIKVQTKSVIDKIQRTRERLLQ